MRANDGGRRAGLVHRALVSGGIGIVAVEPEEIELPGRLRPCRHLLDSGRALLLATAVVFGILIVFGSGHARVGRAGQAGPVVVTYGWPVRGRTGTALHWVPGKDTGLSQC